MNPGDWVAPSMDHPDWMSEPFQFGGDAVTCDGFSVVSWPQRGFEFWPPRHAKNSELSRVGRDLHAALVAQTAPPSCHITDLGMGEQYVARLVGVPGLQIQVESNRVLFKVIDPDEGTLTAYGVIYKAAAA